MRFGRRERIWSDEGIYYEDAEAGVIISNLDEDITLRPGLPFDREPDANGVIWM